MTLKEWLQKYHMTTAYRGIIVTKDVEVGSHLVAFGYLYINRDEWDVLTDHKLPKKKSHIKVVYE